MEDNIFGYNKANRPILICPHCGFKHIINFMPFEKEIKTRKIKELNLGGYYPVSIGASKIADANRVDQSNDDDNDVKVGIAWEINTFKYADKFVDMSGENSFITGLRFSADGYKMYVAGSLTGGDKIYQYDLTTAWDVSTASFEKEFDTTPEAINPEALFFSTDGYKMHV